MEPELAPLELLLSHGAHLDPVALFKAMAPRGRGGIPMMRFLIERGVNLNTQWQVYGTPLHYAIHIYSKAKLELLLESGADSTLTDMFGMTPLQKAKAKGYVDFVELLENRYT